MKHRYGSKKSQLEKLKPYLYILPAAAIVIAFRLIPIFLSFLISFFIGVLVEQVNLSAWQIIYIFLKIRSFGNQC